MKKKWGGLGLILFLLIAPLTNSYSEEVIELTIPGVIDIALSNNLNLKLERLAPDIAKENIKVSDSVFDPTVSLEATTSKREMDEEDVDTDSSGNQLQAGIGKTFTYGTKVTVSTSLTNDKDVKDFDDASTISTTRTANLTNLIITQPLLKNRGITVNRHNTIIAENNYKKSELSLKQAIIDTVVQSQNHYWQLYSAIENLDVQEKSLELAKRFLAEVEERVRLGNAAAIDTLQAKAEVASREEDVIIAEKKEYNNQDSLLSYIYGRLSNINQVKCTQAPLFEAVETNEEELFITAKNSRVDYLKALYDLASADVDLEYLKNQKSPNLNLTAALGVNNGNLKNDDVEVAAYQDYYSGSLTLSLDFPWGFKKDSANYQAAFLSHKQSLLRLKNIENQILLEVRTALRNVDSLQKRYQAATLTSQLAEEKLQAEQEKFKNGLSTSYNVLLYQRDLTDARVRMVDATIDYQLAIVELYKSVGTTLEHNNIQIKGANQ